MSRTWPNRAGRRNTAPKRRTSCPTGKNRWATAEDAEAEIARIRTITDRARTPVRAYPCPDCAGWHLTSQQRRPA